MPTKRHSKTLVRHAETAEQLRARIIAALNSDRYKARTISGIAQAVNTGEMVITKAIKNDPELRQAVKIYPRRASDGRVLITTKQRFYKEASFSDKLIDVFAMERLEL